MCSCVNKVYSLICQHIFSSWLKKTLKKYSVCIGYPVKKFWLTKDLKTTYMYNIEKKYFVQQNIYLESKVYKSVFFIIQNKKWMDLNLLLHHPPRYAHVYPLMKRILDFERLSLFTWYKIFSAYRTVSENFRETYSAERPTGSALEHLVFPLATRPNRSVAFRANKTINFQTGNWRVNNLPPAHGARWIFIFHRIGASLAANARLIRDKWHVLPSEHWRRGCSCCC